MTTIGAGQAKRMKILVIDDDALIIKLLVAVLSGEGYEVISSDNPVDGIERVARDKPDLVILDHYMEPITGMDVLAQLRRDAGSLRTPILMLTAANTIKSVNMAFDLGATDYITKPVNLDKLRRKVDALLAACR
ncbi:MAG: response regulator [Elusimicrobiota bacterium]